MAKNPIDELDLLDEGDQDVRGANFLRQNGGFDDFDLGQPSISNDNLRFLQETHGEIHHLVMSLKRHRLTTDGTYKPSKSRPMLNNEGIQYVKTILDGTLTKISSLSTLAEGDVEKRTMAIMEPFIWNLAVNQIEYSIEKSDLSTIVALVHNMVYMQYARATKGADKKFISGVWGSRETIDKRDDGRMRI